MTTENFHYTTRAGAALTLPRFDQLPFGVVRRLRHQEPTEQVFSLIEEVCDEGTLAVVDTLTTQEITDLYTAWQREGQVSQGESSASAGS